MSNHTPGPWEIKRHFDPGYKFISAPKHSHLAQVVWCMEDEGRSPECEANAYLIAAAPELLEALDKIIGLAKVGRMVHVINTAKAAIAKAKGEGNE